MKPLSNILVVDDSPANIGLLLDALRGEHRLLVAESAEGCLEQLPHQAPDLILLDVMMPGMNGFELCSILKADERWRDIPVIFMTAVDEPEHKQRAIEQGAVDYVTKPIFVPEVMARVRTHLRIFALQRELKQKNEDLQEEVSMRRETEEQLERSLDRALITAGRDGQVTFSSHAAEALLRRYYGAERFVLLPEAFLAEWKDSLVSGNKHWYRKHPELDAKIKIAVFENPEDSDVALFQLSEEGAVSCSALKKLGLSPRECEVLYWISEGKNYPEIATIISAGVRTVHKHSENLMRKLNVESRAAAMRLALDALGRVRG